MHVQGGRRKRLEEQGRAAEAAKQGLSRQRSRMERVLAGGELAEGDGEVPAQGEELLGDSVVDSSPEPDRCLPWPSPGSIRQAADQLRTLTQCSEQQLCTPPLRAKACRW